MKTCVKINKFIKQNILTSINKELILERRKKRALLYSPDGTLHIKRNKKLDKYKPEYVE